MIEQYVHWNEDIGEWQLKCVAYTGNNMRKQTQADDKKRNKVGINKWFCPSVSDLIVICMMQCLWQMLSKYFRRSFFTFSIYLFGLELTTVLELI